MAWEAHPPTTNGACTVDRTVIAVAQLAISIGEPDANRKAAATAVNEAAGQATVATRQPGPIPARR